MDFLFIENSIDEMVAEVREHEVFSIDLETTGLSPIDSRLLLCQIGIPGKQFVVRTWNNDLSALFPLLEDRNYIKLAHNAKFEHKFIQRYWKTFMRNVFCTMIAEQIIMSDKNASSLASVTLKYTGEVLDKNPQTSFIGMKPMDMFTDVQLSYAAKDVQILFPIYEAQKEEIKKSGQEAVARIEFDCIGVVAAMENEGIPIDSDAWKAKFAEYGSKLSESKQNLHSILFDGTGLQEQTGMFERDSINLGSPQQIGNAFTAIGIKLEKTPKGHWKTDERSLSTINHPAAKELLNHRGYQKLMDAYGDSFLDKIHPFDQRLHPDFQQIGTETGRFSCREPNVQQIPEELRECVGGLEDYLIVGADYANIELRIIAELSGDKALAKAFSLGDDPHKSTASLMFGIDIADVTKDQRFIAKTINFGLTYGMGPGKLMDMLNENRPANDKLSINKVYAIMNKYRDTYSDVTRFFRESGVTVFNRGWSKTILGRKRYFDRPSNVDEETFKKQKAAIERAGGNAPIQGTNAEITKLAMVNLQDDLMLYGFRASIINAVHDEIVVLAHKSSAESVKEVVTESMIRSGQEVIKSVPVKVDVYSSKYWKKG